MALTGYEKPLDQYTQKELVEIAKEYNPYYQTASGKGKLAGYERLTKQQLINIIKVDIEYIEANPKLPRRIKGPTYRKSKSKSLTELKESLLGVENPDELMNEILSRLSGSEVPETRMPGIPPVKNPGLKWNRDCRSIEAKPAKDRSSAETVVRPEFVLT